MITRFISSGDNLDGEIPDHIEEIMETKEGGAPCSMAFNRRGTILAAGTNNGCISLFDFDTKSQVILLRGHKEGSIVKALAWSRDGRTLASAANDGHLILWDVTSGEKKNSVTLPHPDVSGLSLTQRAPFRGLVSYSLRHPPSLIDFDGASTQNLPESARDQSISDAVMSRDGKEIFLSQGNQLSKLDALTLKPIETTTLNSPITKISRSQKSLIVSCEDGNLFIYPAEGSTMTAKGPFFHSIADGSNKITCWSDFCLTQDGSYLAAVANLLSLQIPIGEHLVYFWSLATCELERVLEGLEESNKHNAIAITAHPILPVIVTVTDPVSSNSSLYIWAKIQVENWSAFAPDFQELQENRLYVEAEDEFDWNTEGNMSTKIEVVEKRKANLTADAQADSLIIDVYSMDKRVGALSSDDEEDEQGFFYLPVVISAEPQVEEVEEEVEEKPVEEEHAKAIEAIQQAEMEDMLNQDEDVEPHRRKTRSRGNSRVNSRAASPTEDDQATKRQKN